MSDLAGAAYAEPSEGKLDLRWTPDEIDWLAPDPRTVWAGVLAEGPVAVAERARAYNLADPYAAIRAAPVLSRHFGVELPPDHLTFGAGAASLLRDLVTLARGGPVLASRFCFPDFPAWARLSGSTVRFLDDSLPPSAWIQLVERLRPSLLLVDRPTLLGAVHPLRALEPALVAADQTGTIVVIDESYANYLGAEASAVPLTRRDISLVVVRGLSKGYCQGGLRVGYAVCAAPLAARVRETVPALQASELSVHIALRILELGDPFQPLRDRLGQARPLALRCLRALGFNHVRGHPALPWLTILDTTDTRLRLAERGILAKAVTTSAVKMAIPLSEARVRGLADAIGMAPEMPFSRFGGIL